MSVDISFGHAVDYWNDEVRGARGPALRLELSSPFDTDGAIDITAHLDSGATDTIFQGDLASLIGLNLLDGEHKPFVTSTGYPMDAKVHRVRVAHSMLGEHEMDVAFAMGQLSRNLLGLDFFKLYKVCFREYHQRLFFDPE